MTTHNIELLEKLAQIHSWHRECCQWIREIALQNSQQFVEEFRQIEHWLSVSKSDEPLAAAKDALSDLCYSIYHIVISSDPLYQLVLSQPLLSEADVDQVTDYACIADVSPDPNPMLMLNSKDALFMKLLGRILKQFSIIPENIFQENLAALVALHLEYPLLSQQLRTLAEIYDWSELVRRLQRALGDEDISVEKLEHLPEAAKVPFQAFMDQEKKEREKLQADAAAQAADPGLINNPTQIQQKPSLREFLFIDLEVTTIQREEVLLFWQVEGELDGVQNSLQQPSWGDFSAKQKGELIAKELLKQGLISDEASNLIRDRIARRTEAARHYVSLREYVKFNALNHSWPELSSELINNRTNFMKFESRMLDIETLGKEASGLGELTRLLQRYQDNDQLLHFLQLRPYFRGLSVEKAKEIYSLTSSLPQSETGKAEPEKTPPQSQVPSQTGSDASAIPVSTAEVEVFTNLYITIAKSTDQVAGEWDYACQISARIEDLSVVSIDTQITIRGQDIDSIKNSAYNLMRIPFGNSESRSPASDQTYQRAPMAEQPRRKLLSVYLKEIGLQLCNIFFTDDLVKFLVNALNSHPKIRFVLEIKIPEFYSLPWECLYISELKLPVALVSKHSLVRYSPSANKSLSQAWGAKIRILTVFSGPIDQAPLKLEEEAKELKEVFEGVARVDIVTIPHITIDEFSSQIRRFKPHIIHFSGHGGLDQRTGEGALIFEREDGKAQYIYASQFSTLCRDQNVSMVVLNACDTGTAIANDVVTSVAGALIEAGIPATVATTRAIFDFQSIMFVREFYRALADGYPIESAMAEARKRVNSEDWDWSAFALFVSTLDLDRYKLLIERK